MKNIRSRFFDYQKDIEKLTEAWLVHRAATDVRMYPTIWRIRLLLTSRVWDVKQDTRIWEDESRKIIGFAMLWRRYSDSPYTVLEGFTHPKFTTQSVCRAILEWGDKRAREIANIHQGEFEAHVVGFSQRSFPEDVIRHLGYDIVPPNPDNHDVYFSKSLLEKIVPSQLPLGYNIRKLKGMNDLESYNEISGFAKVATRHQKELLESDEYCCLVATNPNDKFVAYCECSICRAEWEKTHQQIGWIDYIETISEEQRKGIGRAILSAGLLQLQEWKSKTAMLVTISTNLPAVNLYKKAGFNSVETSKYPNYKKIIIS